MKKTSYKKRHEKYLRSAQGESNRSPSYDDGFSVLKDHLPESEADASTTVGLNRRQNRWGRYATSMRKKLRTEYPGLKTLRDGGHDHVYFVPFEELYTDVSRGVDPSNPKLVHRRACLITAQAIMCDVFKLKWEKALQLAVTGVPPVPKADGSDLLTPWHEYVKTYLDDVAVEKLDNFLMQKMSRFTQKPTAQKRVHARSIDAHLLRDDVVAILEAEGLPEELLEKELQQSFNPCFGSGYAGNLPKFLEYFRQKRNFSGDIRIARAASDFVVKSVLDAAGGSIQPYTVERAFAWLYKKTRGRTEVGGRFHCKQEKLGRAGVERILEDARNITQLTTRLPSELGNRFVPAKNVYGESGNELIERYKIVDCVAKDRTTFAVYKSKQIKDLSYVYPLQKVMSSMQWFVALMGHDATFNVSEKENYIALEIYNALRQHDAWGASWDFSSHDAYLDIITKLLYGQEEFDGWGLLPRIFPDSDPEEWRWLYEASSQGSCFIEGGLAFTDYNSVRGVSSGEGFTNGGESLAGAVMLIDQLLHHVKRVIGDEVYRLIEVDGFMEQLVSSTVMLFMGDDTCSITNHPDFISAINYGLNQIGADLIGLDAIGSIQPEDAAESFRAYGTNPSTDRKKISFFDRKSPRRMMDFTAHQSFVTFDENGEVREHYHGYYCFCRALASFTYAEARSPQENLVAEARFNGAKVQLGDVYHNEVLAFFAALQYSILSSLFMNPTRFTDQVVKRALRDVPHYGGLYALARSPETADKYLQNIRIRENLRGRGLSESPVFKSMLHAFDELINGSDVPPEVQVFIDWYDYCVANKDDTLQLDVYAFMQGHALAQSTWQILFELYPDEKDPAKNAKHKREMEVIREDLDDIDAAFEGSLRDSIFYHYAKVTKNNGRTV